MDWLQINWLSMSLFKKFTFYTLGIEMDARDCHNISYSPQNAIQRNQSTSQDDKSNGAIKEIKGIRAKEIHKQNKIKPVSSKSRLQPDFGRYESMGKTASADKWLIGSKQMAHNLSDRQLESTTKEFFGWSILSQRFYTIIRWNSSWSFH